MKILLFIKKTLSNTALIYTFISLGMLVLANYIEHGAASGANYVPNLSFSLLVLAFGFVCALSHAIKDELKINSALKNTLAFIVSYAAFYLCFFVWSGNSSQFSSIAIFSTAFIIVYAIVKAINTLVNRKPAQEEYKEVFSELENK